MSGDVDLRGVDIDQAAGPDPAERGHTIDRDRAHEQDEDGATGRGAGRRRLFSSWGGVAAGAGIVGVVVSPIVVGALALIGDPWLPMSDWASLVHRVSQVGTRETPLVGPYSFHGFAHPGPLLYWVTAPLYRLTGGDARSVLWMGAVVNVVAVGALAAVAWRRGRWPLLLGVMTLVALLVHGIGPEALVDMWNPHVALLPFLLTVLLLWDAGLGRRRALLEALVPATFAVQAHLAFLTLTGLVVAWLAAWWLWQDRLVPDAGPARGDADARDDAGRRPGWVVRRRVVLVGGGLLVLWAGPLLDALFDLHNPVNVARSLLRPDETIGPADAPALVGYHVRLDGAWLGGGEPDVFLTSRPLADALHLVALLAVLAGCLVVARHRRLVDAAALVTLSAVLLVGAVPATSQLITPTPSYLTQWLKVIGGLAWFSVAWTGWRLVEPVLLARRAPAPAGPAHSRSPADRSLAPAGPGRSGSLGGLVPRRWLAGALAAAALVGATAWTWPDARRNDPPHGEGAGVVQAVRDELQRALPRDRVYRVEVVGDPTSHFTGLIYWMIEDGFEVVTSDGDEGLKWGHAHRWTPGDPYDALLTIAVTQASVSGAYDDCQEDPGVRQVVAYDGLTSEERGWLLALAWRRMEDAEAGTDSLSAAEDRRAARLLRRDLRIGVFEGPETCGE